MSNSFIARRGPAIAHALLGLGLGVAIPTAIVEATMPTFLDERAYDSWELRMINIRIAACYGFATGVFAPITMPLTALSYLPRALGVQGIPAHEESGGES